LSFTYGNTNKDLNLPKVVEETVYFLLIWDIEAQVSNLVQRFVEKLMAANGNVLDLGTRTDKSKKDIMLLATVLWFMFGITELFQCFAIPQLDQSKPQCEESFVLDYTSKVPRGAF
jgi:hypothetical protein